MFRLIQDLLSPSGQKESAADAWLNSPAARTQGEVVCRAALTRWESKRWRPFFPQQWRVERGFWIQGLEQMLCFSAKIDAWRNSAVKKVRFACSLMLRRKTAANIRRACWCSRCTQEILVGGRTRAARLKIGDVFFWMS